MEPGTPAGFRQLRAAREYLLGQGARLVAPCPHEKACPTPETDWCHFSARLARGRVHKYLKDGAAPYEDEKYAYLAVSRSDARPARARIVRHPRVDKNRVVLELCTPAGRREVLVTRKDGPAFKAAGKARWGDPWEF